MVVITQAQSLGLRFVCGGAADGDRPLQRDPVPECEFEDQPREWLSTPADRWTGIVRAERQRDLQAEDVANACEAFGDAISCELTTTHLRSPGVGEEQPAIVAIALQDLSTPRRERHVLRIERGRLDENLVELEDDGPRVRVRRQLARE